MKIFNQEKTEELNYEDLDFTKGHLIYDKLFIKHHNFVPEKPAKTASQVAEELKSEGLKVEEINDKLYLIEKTFENGGRTVKEIKEEPFVPAVEEYDEYEDIQVYKPYTEDELLEIEKNKFRLWRQKYFNIIDRAVWFDTLSDDEKQEVREFRKKLLDITDTLEYPTVPKCIAQEVKDENRIS